MSLSFMRRQTVVLFVALMAALLGGAACEQIGTAPAVDPSLWPGPVPPPPPPPNPRIQFTKYLAFGDSLTEGFLKGIAAQTYIPNLINGDVDPKTAGPTTGFPFKLKALLPARYIEQTFVMYDAGWAGRRAEREVIEDRINAVLSYLGETPEVMLLMEGVNDFIDGDTIPHVISYLQSLKNEGQSRGMKVLVLTLPPETCACKGPGNPTVLAFNDAIRAQFGSDVIDIYPAVTTSMVGPDTLHLLETGNQAIAEVVFARLQQLYEIPLISK